jgi:uncharacterized protein (TIGR00290 family)
MKNSLTPAYLASMIFMDTGRLWPHNLLPEILQIQAEAIGLPIIQPIASADTYDDVFRSMLLSLKDKGINGGVFGDVSVGNPLVDKHRDWIEGVCHPTGITPHLPLWDEDRETLLRDFIDSGFEAIVISSDENLGKDWLGRRVDYEMLAELKAIHEASPTGEVGYYHTFVIDGPIYEKRLEILETEPVFRHGFWYLNILEVALTARVAPDVT